MQKPKILLRILCTLLDVILVMIPIQFLMMGIFKVSEGQAELLYKFLFAVYGALMTEYCGRSVGKYFGKLTVVDTSGNKASILFLGLRELVKAMYFIPVIGWLFCLVSIIMMIIRKDGRGLHDIVGNTQAAYLYQLKEDDAGE